MRQPGWTHTKPLMRAESREFSAKDSYSTSCFLALKNYYFSHVTFLLSCHCHCFCTLIFCGKKIFFSFFEPFFFFFFALYSHCQGSHSSIPFCWCARCRGSHLLINISRGSILRAICSFLRSVELSRRVSAKVELLSSVTYESLENDATSVLVEVLLSKPEWTTSEWTTRMTQRMNGIYQWTTTLWYWVGGFVHCNASQRSLGEQWYVFIGIHVASSHMTPPTPNTHAHT